MNEIPHRIPEPIFKDHEGVEVDDPTTCRNSPTSHHRFLMESAESEAQLACLYCRKLADPLPPDPMDSWRHYE